MENAKRFFGTCALVVVAALQFGCGGGETNTPSTKLTASAVTSNADASAHAHVVTIPFTDVNASPTSDVYQYRTDVVNGHSHVIAITKQQMTDLNNGMRLELTSSAASSGTAHTHTWTIQGGSVLYEKNCYNCHSNDKRGKNPMNVSFNSSQTDAVKNPGSAPLSTSPAAVPDPNFTASAAAFDGAATYKSVCLGCHGTLGARSAAQISAAISSVGQMNYLSSYTADQIAAIAAASQGTTPPVTTPPATTAPTAPTSVTAVGGATQVTVTWPVVSGAVSYNLYRSTTTGVTTSGTKIAGVTSPYSNTGLVAGTTYYYIVTAVNSVGESAASAQVSAVTTAAITVPAFDALATYNSVCLGCHGTLGVRTAAQITTAIANIGSMKSLTYTAAQISAMAAVSH